MERALVLSGGGARGAFHVGVWKYLLEAGWKPGLICGTSVGAIVGAGIASGMGLERMINLWLKYDNSRMYRPAIDKFVFSLLAGRKFKPIADTARLRTMLLDNLNFDDLKKSPIRLIIAALNMRKSQIEYFGNEAITIDHMMAAGAVPLFFPWHRLKGTPYWDAGLMANTPIRPAIEYGAKSIIVVFLSPLGVFDQPEPRTHSQVVNLIGEQFLHGSYSTFPFDLLKTDAEIRVVAPTRMLGLRSILNFNKRKARRLISEGYECARNQLESLR